MPAISIMEITDLEDSGAAEDLADPEDSAAQAGREVLKQPADRAAVVVEAAEDSVAEVDEAAADPADREGAAQDLLAIATATRRSSATGRAATTIASPDRFFTRLATRF